jgi:hypothetical protein
MIKHSKKINNDTSLNLYVYFKSPMHKDVALQQYLYVLDYGRFHPMVAIFRCIKDHMVSSLF